MGQARGRDTPESAPPLGLGTALSHSLATHTHTATKRETSFPPGRPWMCGATRPRRAGAQQVEGLAGHGCGGARVSWSSPSFSLAGLCLGGWLLAQDLPGQVALCLCPSHRQPGNQWPGPGPQCSSGWTNDMESEPSTPDQSSALHTVPEGPPTFPLWPWVKGSLPLRWDSPPSPQPLPSPPHPARPQLGPTFSWHCALLSHFLNLLSCFITTPLWQVMRRTGRPLSSPGPFPICAWCSPG